MPTDLKRGTLELSELKIIHKEDKRRYITMNRILGHLLNLAQQMVH
jgi:hypothetical protein